ncbi:MAG: DUF2520 domain-containing protein [Micrococcales bacterium]|nr:DUF2520 domain-containing protein [Micrococcales bacterium]
MSSQPEPVAFGVIGLGRVGGAVARALFEAGHPALGVSARSQAAKDRADVRLPGLPVLEPAQIAEQAGLVWLTVPDDAIEAVTEELAGYWRPGQIVVHTSGAKGVAALDKASANGAIGLAIHPVMTFTGTSLDVAAMRQAPFAVTTPPGFEPIAMALVQELGGHGFYVSEADRPLYHTALAHLSNHLVTLVDQVRSLIQAATSEDPALILEPLAKASLHGALSNGIVALTGPISRGDLATVRLHREALVRFAASRGALVDGAMALDPSGAAALDLVNTYLELAKTTARAAERAGRIEHQVAQAIEAALTKSTKP